MGKKLYVGNLPFSVGEEDLAEMFSQIGNVESARVIFDRDTGRSKGFGFVEMASDDEAANAINKLNGYQVDGRTLTVNEARPQEPRMNGGPRREGGGGGGGHRGFRGGMGGGGGGRPRY